MTTQILKNWHKVRLDEIANFEYGYTASAKENDTGTKLLRITDIVPDLIDWNTVPFCEIDEKGVRQFEIKKGDILIARTGATAGYAKLIRKQPQKSVFASYLIRVRMKKADVSPEYVGRIVESEMFKQFVTTHAGGSAQPHANAPVLKNFELLLPDAKTQTEIVDVLSAYDDLIENNTRRIQILEQLAQAIYTEWFMNFRFPGHEEIRMIDSGTDFGKIPEGWEVKKVGEMLAKISRKYKVKKTDYNEVGDFPVIDQGHNFIGGYTSNSEAIYQELPLIVFGDHTRILKFIDFPFACGADGTQLLFSNDLKRMPMTLFFYALQNINLSNFHYARHFKFLKEKKILVPDQRTASLFDEQIWPCQNVIKSLQNQTLNLRQTRDLLLPKLVTGEIQV